MDITQTLKDTENALRDFIASVLSRSLGSDWIEKCGVTEARIQRWKERKLAEEKRQEAGVVDERILYYADFYDLRTILKKNWDKEFSFALGDWKRMEILLEELEKLRDPEAHRRELLPHQKNLALGIAGEIRARLIRYRNRLETIDDCFPRIESARDNLGNIWTPDLPMNSVSTNMILRPGDMIDYIVTASDPEEMPIEYGIRTDDVNTTRWQSHGNFSIKITEKCIGKYFDVNLFIRSQRPYHAHGSWDSRVTFGYSVLPNR